MPISFPIFKVAAASSPFVASECSINNKLSNDVASGVGRLLISSPSCAQRKQQQQQRQLAEEEQNE